MKRLISALLIVVVSAVYAHSQTIFRLQDETELIHMPSISEEYFAGKELEIEQLEQTVKANPKDVDAIVQLCYRLKSAGRHSDACDAITSAVSHLPSDQMLVNMAGAVLLHSHRYEELEQICRDAIASDPQCADAYNLMGIIAQERGYTGTAIYHFEKALSLKKKKYNWINFNLANAYRAAGRYDDAIELYDKSRKKFMADPNFVSVRNFKFRQPSEAWVYSNIGLTLTMARKYDDALSAYRRALQSAHRQARIFNGMACTFYEMGLPDSSLKYLNRAIEESPRHSSSYKNLGNIYYERGEQARALKLYLNAYELDDSDEWLICKIGVILKNQKEYSMAVEYFKKAIEIEPSDAEAHYQMGLCYYRLSLTADAQAAFRTALRLGCENARGWIR